MSLTQMCASHLQASEVQAQLVTEAKAAANWVNSLCQPSAPMRVCHLQASQVQALSTWAKAYAKWVVLQCPAMRLDVCM